MKEEGDFAAGTDLLSFVRSADRGNDEHSGHFTDAEGE